MSAGQAIPFDRPIDRRQTMIAALLLAATFAVGLAFGANLPRVAVPSGQVASLPRALAFEGVAVNNMSDAAYAARYAPASSWFEGVADNNMSDAAAGAVGDSRSFTGVAANNMSDSVDQTLYGPSVNGFSGVAANNMSDAALAATQGR